MSELLYSNLSINEAGHLCFAGLDTTELASEYGTPLYLLDADRVRDNAKRFTGAIAQNFGAGSMAYYASKALCFKGIYPLIAELGMGADVVSSGEIATALSAGFPAAKLCFHGSNKTDADLEYALSSGVGIIVIDNFEELAALERVAAAAHTTQDVLLRLSVGVDAHTFEAVTTGRVDSQFGVAIETGQAKDFCAAALACEHLKVLGFHSHIGSQIFDASAYLLAVNALCDFATNVRDELGFCASVFNLGGGFGVPYVSDDSTLKLEDVLRELAEQLRETCTEHNYPLPKVFFEPGRAIVADAGITLYSAGGVKTIEGYKSYVTVDGGMTDNPRYALYKSKYTVINASRANEPANFECTLAGRCCESGDRIAENIMIARPKRDDIIAVLTTGAYNFSMASNYNRLMRPALVLVEGGTSRLAVRRQTIADLLALES